MFWNVLGWIGLLVVLYYGFWIIVDVIRCFYWAIWCTIAEARHNMDRVTVLRVIKVVWSRFIDELLGEFVYEKKSCKYYSHGYWPWQEREWY